MNACARPSLLVCDSVTHLDAQARGRVVLAASHGGLYAVRVALAEGVRALIVNDAGVGLDDAGVAGLAHADTMGVPCAAIDHLSARIGDGADGLARGVISFANAAAARLGVRPGMRADEAARCLESAPGAGQAAGMPPDEARTALPVRPGERAVVLMDSASLVQEGDAGAVVLTASHGGLLGGREATAIKVPVFAALYNDAGVGRDGAGISRLPVLDRRGIAGATVSAASARIGDARSAWATGVISHANETARAHGARPGQSAREWAACMAAA